MRYYNMVHTIIFFVPLFLRKRTPDFVIKVYWFQVMHYVPLSAFTLMGFSKISTAIGNPITTEECTAKFLKLRISYSRILIEVDVTQPRRKETIIKDVAGRKLRHDAVHEWIQKFCSKMSTYGSYMWYASK